MRIEVAAKSILSKLKSGNLQKRRLEAILIFAICVFWHSLCQAKHINTTFSECLLLFSSEMWYTDCGIEVSAFKKRICPFVLQGIKLRFFRYRIFEGQVNVMPDAFYSLDEFTFIWDEDKDAKNIKKHGIAFRTAARVFEDELRIEYPDPDHSENEERYRTIGLVHDVLTVVYCDRENADTGDVDIRITSARLATKLERNAYNNNIIGRY